MKIIPLYTNEKRLIKLAAKADRAAQKAVYDRYAPKMLSVCRSYIKDIHYAEDVLMNGFLKVFKALPDFNHEGSFEGWIRRIMVRESIDFLRARKKLYFTDDLQNIEIAAQADEERLENADFIQDLIDRLPSGYRTVFILSVVEEYQHKEIAEMLHISAGTSKSQLFKAKKMLREMLKNKGINYGR